MNRRTLLGVIVGSGIIASAGCLNRAQGSNPGAESNPDDVEFELVDPELNSDDPPDVTVDGNTVTVNGTVQYGSSSCGTVELAYVGYEPSQYRLDLLIVAADDTDGDSGCTDDLVETGYRIEIFVDENLRQIAATEHHAFGETYSTTIDQTNW